MTTTYIGLGSNLNDPASQLRQATSAIASLKGCTVEAASRVYRSAAVGPGEQPDYLNAVLRLDTTLQPLALLHALQAIETAHGRTREVRWGARTLDLDILLFGELTSTSTALTLPHPRMHERLFVLRPLLDLCDTKMVLPGGVDLGTLLATCKETLELTNLSLEVENAVPVENQS
ncbi:MAG: 2-amino-4-hydroxy-6-hydroxymethyldihydropteridine diphosphokinase [Halioglobus sp.]